MKHIILLLLLLHVIILCSAQDRKLDLYWDDGIRLMSRDSAYRFSIGGRVHYDLALLRHSPALDTLVEQTGDRVEVRRTRLTFEGLINRALAYEFEFTFGEQIEYADMYLAFLRLPYFERLTVGHFREPFGMEELTSSNATVFMERSLTSTFGPGRNTGIMLQRAWKEGKIRAYGGLFRLTDDLGADLAGAGRHSVTGRLAYNPINDSKENRAVHLGVAFNFYAPADSSFGFEPNNEAHTSPEYVATAALPWAQRVRQVGTELGYTKGRLALQGEYILSSARGERQSVPLQLNNHAAYLTASWFLKGGQRTYSSRANRFSSIELTEKYEQGSMSGAWEAGIRLSRLSLGEAASGISSQTNLTLGLNWYYNSNSRIMLNYVRSFLDGGFQSRALQMRAQVSF